MIIELKTSLRVLLARHAEASSYAIRIQHNTQTDHWSVHAFGARRTAPIGAGTEIEALTAALRWLRIAAAR